MKKLLVTLMALGLAAQQASTDVILAWDVQGEGSPAVTTSAADTIAANLDTSAGRNELSRTGLGAAAAGNSFGGNGWNVTDTFAEGDDYFSFTVQAASGYQLTITSLDYVVNGSNTGPGTGRWGYSVNGGAFTLQSSFGITFATPGSLATWDFADQATGDSIEFRYWAYGATSVNGGTATAAGTSRISNISGNDLVLNGTIAVIPEPGSVAMMGLGALGIWMFGRRRKA